MNERVQCIAAYLSHVYSLTEVCERFGIRLPTSYKGVRRYPAAGAPVRPERHGVHERMHRTLQAEPTRPPAYHQSAQQARCERCCRESNAERPHEARDYRTPAAVDQPSTRPMP